VRSWRRRLETCCDGGGFCRLLRAKAPRGGGALAGCQAESGQGGGVGHAFSYWRSAWAAVNSQKIRVKRASNSAIAHTYSEQNTE
jgi:hypothetical protein